MDRPLYPYRAGQILDPERLRGRWAIMQIDAHYAYQTSLVCLTLCPVDGRGLLTDESVIRYVDEFAEGVSEDLLLGPVDIVDALYLQHTPTHVEYVGA